MEVIAGFAVFAALVSAAAALRFARMWQRAEDRLVESEIEKLLLDAAVDHWRAEALRGRGAVPRVGTLTTADLHRRGVRVARFWLN